MSLAAENGSSAFFTQMLRVSSYGFMKAISRPSGEICAPAISGLPKNSSRSSSGGTPSRLACARAGAGASTAAIASAEITDKTART